MFSERECMSDIDEMLGNYLDRHSKNIFKTKDWNQVIKLAKENKAQTKTAIYQTLVAKMPKKYSDETMDKVAALKFPMNYADMKGHNQCLNEVNEILREYFGVSE